MLAWFESSSWGSMQVKQRKLCISHHVYPTEHTWNQQVEHNMHMIANCDHSECFQSWTTDCPYSSHSQANWHTENHITFFSIQVPIFASADSAFLRHLTLMIKPCLFLPKEYIVHKGDVGLGMFFLYHGTVNYDHTCFTCLHLEFKLIVISIL